MNNIFRIVSVLSKILTLSNSKDIKKLHYLEITHDNLESVEKLLEENEINDYENLGERLSINLKNIIPNTRFFLNELVLRERVGVSPEILDDKNIVILNFFGETFFYNSESKETFINEKLSFIYTVSNLQGYCNFINRLKSQEFADFYDTLENEIILYSSIKGILKIPIPIVPIHLDADKPYSEIFKKTIEKLLDPNFRIHFKNQLFNLNKETKYSPVEALVKNLEIIIQEAENNFQLQLKQFSFDKFKNDLQKEKEKYFNSLREILNKIFSQIVGVPISIGASVFATYKVMDKFAIFMIMFAFGVYVFFAIHLQLIYKRDILEIEKDFKNDFDDIVKKSGIIESTITIEREKIQRRIEIIKNTIYYFITCVSILAWLFFYFMVSQFFGYTKLV